MFGIGWIDSLGGKFNCSRLKCSALVEVKINCEIPNTVHIRAAPKSGRRKEVPHLPRVQTIPRLNYRAQKGAWLRRVWTAPRFHRLHCPLGAEDRGVEGQHVGLKQVRLITDAANVGTPSAQSGVDRGKERVPIS